MSKKRKSFTLDPEVAAYLTEQGRNGSQTVNKLVRQEMDGGFQDVQLLEMRIERTKHEYEDLANRARNKLVEHNRLKESLKQVKQEENRTVEKARKELDGADMDPENPAIQNWAKKAGLEPEELIDRL